MRRPAPWLLLIAAEAGLGGIAWAWARGAGIALGPRLHVAWGDVLVGLAATAPLLGLLAAAVGAEWPPAVRLRRFVETTLGPRLVSASNGELLGLAAAAGCGEELLFRGVIQPVAQQSGGMVGGWAATSLAFGALHAATPAYFVLATVVGGYLGVVAAAGDSLWPAMLAHAVYDACALAWLRRQAQSAAGLAG
jgi:membrane protease YdiL (CAAX protease family)